MGRRTRTVGRTVDGLERRRRPLALRGDREHGRLPTSASPRVMPGGRRSRSTSAGATRVVRRNSARVSVGARLGTVLSRLRAVGEVEAPRPHRAEAPRNVVVEAATTARSNRDRRSLGISVRVPRASV